MLNKKYASIKVLCIEDEDEIRKNQVDYIKRIFSHVYEACNAKEALTLIEKVNPHIVITDIKMDDTSGLDLIRHVRKKDKETKFIVLSAFSNKEYLFDAIDLGLVKYLIKPIDHETFYPILTQCANDVLEQNMSVIALSGSCSFDTVNLRIHMGDKTYTLSKQEADLLKLLYDNRPNVITYELIEYHVWANSSMSEYSLRTLIKDLRKKLPVDAITNLSKVGYNLNLD